ncbi:MAG: hypothetical protein KIT84_21620 [Labilithrix sp.]|nr:hypothetical protein [Labilithrix sp.]MCW5813643.1 hypothetical protein [Labilithrix sp.]
MAITHQVFVEPSAIAVGLPEEQLVLCIEVFGRAGLRVHRADPDAACERLTKLLPQIVVVATELDFSLREMIDDRAVAVGAVTVALPASADFATIEEMLDTAVATSRELRGKKPRSA